MDAGRNAGVVATTVRSELHRYLVFDSLVESGTPGCFVRQFVFSTAVALMTLASVPLAPADGQQVRLTPPPNNTPLAFGMNAGQAAQALGVSLNYVRGRRGDELYVALPNVKGSALSIRSDGLYLQFRKGRLEGWKGDWGTIRP